MIYLYRMRLATAGTAANLATASPVVAEVPVTVMLTLLRWLVMR